MAKTSTEPGCFWPLWCLAAFLLVWPAFLPATPTFFGQNFTAAAGGLTTPTVTQATSGSVTGTNTCTVTGVNVSGANKLLDVWIAQGEGGGSPNSITSVTWSGNGTPQTATLVTSSAATDANFNHGSWYRLIAPTNQTGGTVTVVIGGSSQMLEVLVLSINGADQTTPIDDVAVANAANSTATFTVTSTTGYLNVIGYATDANSTLTAGGTASPTSQVKVEGVGSDVGAIIITTTAAGTAQATWTPPDNGWAGSRHRVKGV